MSITLVEAVMWGLAASMGVTTSYALKWTVQHFRVRGSLMIPFVVFLLVMMLSMVVSAVVYLYSPSINMLIGLVVANMLVMGAGALPFVFVMFRALLADHEPGQGGDGDPSAPPPAGAGFPHRDALVEGTVIGLALLNEFFMGWAFELASSGPLSLGNGTPVAVFSSVVGSYWFLFTMSLEMALTTYFVRKELGRTFLYLVGMQSLVMFLSPTAVADPVWVAVSVFGMSVVMIVLFVFAFEHLARNRMTEKAVAGYLLKLVGAYALMMAGLFVWRLTASETLFALSVVLEMGVYLDLVLSGKRDASLWRWQSDPWWVLGLLSALFVGEFFMGALLDAQVYGTQAFIASMGLVPVAGAGLSALWAAAYDAMVFFGVVSLSPWFLAMMGAEMGALVVFRVREVRELETKVRLCLVMAAYSVYAVLLPGFLIPASLLPKVPFVGWSMGVGTAGAVAPATIVALAGTYLVSGSLSFLFGARQVCSMFCTAALMYQGTFYDSMKTFNRTSRIGRKMLTSRLSGAYKATFSLVWVSLIGAALVSYLDSVGALRLTVFGADPAYLLYLFYFGVLWYVIFVTIPFVGTYACVNMGWCHWGTFNQLVGRLGFFRLKVRDPGVCVTCETKDCARACPVGLTDLPGSFMATGEFKSLKCIGVGDCVSACPYENEYFFDVRHWLRLRRGKKTPRAVDLPLVRANQGASAREP